MTFYEKYLLLCQKKGKSPSGAALEIPLSKTTVNRWKNGGGITDANAMRVAAYFRITVEELMSGVDGAKKETPDPTIEGKRSTVSSFIRESNDASVLLDIMNEVAQKLKELEKKNGK